MNLCAVNSNHRLVSLGNQSLASSFRAEEEAEFGSIRLGYPTDRRPAQYRRQLSTDGDSEVTAWVIPFAAMIGPLVKTSEERASDSS